MTKANNPSGGEDEKVTYDDTDKDDPALVRAACMGDKQAFADIYDRYGTRIYNFLCSVMRNRDDAADVLQDTFITAGSRLHQLRDPSKLRPWLYAIARHHATRALSRAGRSDPLEDMEVTDTAPLPEQVAAQSELSGLIAAAAQGLGTQERIVLDLHLRQGLEGQELGDAIGVSPSHAYVLLTRMRDQVERSLGALLVARQGRKECSELANLLQGWDGNYSALWRKRIARHVDRCDECTGLRKRVLSPISLMAAVPLMPGPAEAREMILERVQLVKFSKGLGPSGGDRNGSSLGIEVWPARYGGFPPPMVRRSKKGLAVVSAALVLLLIGASTLAGAFDPRAPQLVLPTKSPESALLQFPDVPTPELLPAAVAQPEPTHPPVVLTPVPKPSPAAGAGQASPPPAGKPSPADESDPPPAGGGTSGSGPAAGPADNEPPSLTLHIDPRQIWADGPCGNSRPRTARVTAATSDASGIKEVVLSYGGPRPASVPMTGQGSYFATIGPFASSEVRPGQSITIPVTVRSTDQAGNDSTATGRLVVTCDPAAPLTGR